MNDTPSVGTDLDPQTARELLESHMAELLAIPDAQVRRSIIDGERSAELTYELAQAFAPLTPQLDTTFAPAVAAARRADLDAAPQQSRVFVAAEVVASAPWTPEQQKRRKHLAARVAAHDPSLLLWFRPYLSQDDDGLALLAEVTPHTGVRDNARDTSRVADEAIARMDTGTIPQTVGPWTRNNLRTASAEALELLTLLGEPGTKAGTPSDLRNRAFTQWAATYERLVNVGRFLAVERPDLGITFDGIHSPARKTAATKAVPADTVEQPPVPEESPS